LYLIDIRMPTMDGIEFYRQLKIELPRLLDKIVFTTGDLMNIDVIDFLEETGRPLLPKPFSIEELKNMVRRSLGIASG
jgi:CheY-like chemotaxis protein